MNRKKLMIASLAIVLAVGSAFAPRPNNQKALLENLWNKNTSGNCVEFDCETNFTISCNDYYLSSSACESQTSPVTNSLTHN